MLLKRLKSKLHTVIAVLLVCLLVIECVPLSFAEEDIKGKVIEGYKTITVVKWHRICSQSAQGLSGPPDSDHDLHPGLVMWRAYGATTYYANNGLNGKYDGDPRFLGDNWANVAGVSSGYVPADPTDTSVKTFYTIGSPTTWQIAWSGSKDGKNSNIKEYNFQPTPGVWLTGDSKFEQKGGAPGYRRWGLATHDVSGSKYGKDNTSDGFCQIYCEDTGRDTIFNWKGGNSLRGYLSGSYDQDDFAVFWGEEQTFSAITEDTVIAKDQVMNVDDGIVIADGVTLTIQPGGLLSIEGQLFNNGTIMNYGTVVLQENACLSGFMPKNDNYDVGRIVCSGASVSSYDIYSAMANQLTQKKNNAQKKVNDCTAAQKTASDTKDAAEKDYEDYITGEGRDAKYAYDMDNDSSDPERVKLHEYRRQIGSEFVAAKTYYEELCSAEHTPPATEEEKAAAKAVYDAATKAFQAKEEGGMSVEDYYMLIAPLQEKMQAVDNAKAALDVANQNLAQAQGELSSFTEQLNIAIRRRDNASQSDDKMAGEGNLIVMKNARIFFDSCYSTAWSREERCHSSLLIEQGGSVVSSGTIVSPHEVVVKNGKLLIREGGSLVFGRATTANKMSVRYLDLTIDISGTDTLGKENVAWDGCSLFSCRATCHQRIRCEGERCVVENEGKITTAEDPANSSHYTDIRLPVISHDGYNEGNVVTILPHFNTGRIGSR